MGFWESDTGRNYNGYRTQAFDIVDIRPSIGAAVAAVTEAEGKKPYVVTTDARTYSNTISYKALRQKREEEDMPILLLFGTGYGMTKETMEKFILSWNQFTALGNIITYPSVRQRQSS